MLYQKSHIVKKLLAAVMISLVVWINFNNLVFLHTHQLDDGSVVIHAHPYQKSTDDTPLASHEHSIVDFVNIDNVSLLFFSFHAITQAEKAQLNVYLFPLIERIYSKIISSLSTGRAPPVS